MVYVSNFVFDNTSSIFDKMSSKARTSSKPQKMTSGSQVRVANPNKAVTREPSTQMIALCDVARAKLYSVVLDPSSQTDKIIQIATVLQKIISAPLLKLVEEGSTSFEINIDFDDGSIVFQSTIESLTGFDGNLSEDHIQVLKTLSVEESEDLSRYLTKIWKGQVIVERITLDGPEGDDDESMEDDPEEDDDDNDAEGGEEDDECDEDVVDIEDDECVNDGISMSINLF